MTLEDQERLANFAAISLLLGVMKDRLIKTITISSLSLWFIVLVAVFSISLPETLSKPEIFEPDLIEADSAGLLHPQAASWFDGIHTIAMFSVSTPPEMQDQEITYVWDLGNGMKAEGTKIFSVYLNGGSIRIHVEALDKNGQALASGSCLVESQRSPFKIVQTTSGPKISGHQIIHRVNFLSDSLKNFKNSSKLSESKQMTELSSLPTKPEGAGPSKLVPKAKDASRELPPGPDSLFLNISAPGAYFALEGNLESFIGDDSLEQSLEYASSSGGYSIYKALLPGYMRIKTALRDYYIFVSPVPSLHVDRPDMDWYLTQWNTGTTSNCGPTVTAMAVQWARGLGLSVKQVRTIVGWQGNGAISLDDIRKVLNQYQVEWRHLVLNSPEDIFDALDRGHLVAVSYEMSKLSYTKDAGNNMIGQHYTDKGGHYLALKGYSLDHQYIIVYDPIPSDWAYNSKRYGDKYSMYGRNRYFPTTELWNALRSRHALEILPD